MFINLIWFMASVYMVMMGLRKRNDIVYYIEYIPYYPEVKEYIKDTHSAAAAA